MWIAATAAWVCWWQTESECMCEWLRPTRLFAMNCLKGCCPLNAEYECILAEFVKCVRVLVRTRVHVCTVCFFKLALYKLWVRCWRREKAQWTGPQSTGDFLEAFRKTDLSRYCCLLSPSLTPLFMQRSLFWFLAVLIEADKPIHGNAQ